MRKNHCDYEECSGRADNHPTGQPSTWGVVFGAWLQEIPEKTLQQCFIPEMDRGDREEPKCVIRNFLRPLIAERQSLQGRRFARMFT